MSLRYYASTAPPTTLSSPGVDDATTTWPVVSTAAYPATPFLLTCDRGQLSMEVALCQGVVDGTHFDVIRGYDGTTAVAHTPGAVVEHTSSAIDFTESNEHINDTTRDDHAQYMMASGTRHDLTARHAVGSVVPVGAPHASAPGDAQATGSTGQAADAGHVHARESLASLLNSLIPVGLMLPYAVPIPDDSHVPGGFLICNGQAVSRTTYPNLFAALGTTYGNGDGSTTFNVPDLRGRHLIGSSAPGTTVAPDAVGNNYSPAEYGGEEYHTLTIGQLPTHTHGVTDTGHAHPAGSGYDYAVVFDGGGTGLNPGAQIPINNVHYNESATSGVSINNTGSYQPVNIIGPYLTCHWLIKADQ